MSKNFKMLHLYRDDLEAIELILTKGLKAKGFTIADDSYEYNSTKEIDQDTSPSNNLEIKTYPPYASITLNKISARIYFSENSLAEEGAFTQICLILKKRERKIVHYLSNPLAYMLFSFIVLLVTWQIPKNTLSDIGLNIFMILYLPFIILWVLLSFYLHFRKYSVVDFVKKSQRPNFFVRNRDQIGLSVVFTIIGTLLGAIVTKILNG